MTKSSGEELLALRVAVTIARSEQVHSLTALKSRLLGLGFSDMEITTAVRTWADYYARQNYQP